MPGSKKDFCEVPQKADLSLLERLQVPIAGKLEARWEGGWTGKEHQDCKGSCGAL